MLKIPKTLQFLRNGFRNSLSVDPNFRFLAPLLILRFNIHSQKNTQLSDSKIGLILKEVAEIQASKPIEKALNQDLEGPKGTSSPSSIDTKVEISHQWPEWVELMESLLKKKYFVGVSNFDSGELGSSPNLSKDSNRIRTSCLNFARDRFDLIRYFSRNDIRIIVGSGCPSLDRKVVNSGKRLRAHVGIEEGDVCSSCNLRGSCERAYVKAREDEGGRTVDVMRILLTYGLDPIIGSVENKPCLNKMVKESVRSLLKEMVEFSAKEIDPDVPEVNPKRVQSRSLRLSQQQTPKPQIEVPMKQGDWICPKCKFINFAKNIKCLRCDGVFQERLRKIGGERENLPMKKGDWLCGVCNFLNFAKNTKCLQCNEKPPKRQLNPGEWECNSCNYINFRRNMVCLKCDWKRPKAANSTDNSPQHQSEDRDSQQDPKKRVVVRNYIEAINHSFVKTEDQRRDNGVDFWDSDEEQDDTACKFSGFEDFPILGGKGDISKDPQEWKREKGEASKRSKNGFKVSERVAENYAKEWRSVRYECSDGDDDEMAEWFGCGK